MKQSYERQIRENLAKYRKASGLTQEDIDQALGLKEGRTGRLERGKAKMQLSEAINIALTLNVPLVSLLTGDDPGILDIRKHWPRNRLIITELVRMLRDFEVQVEEAWPIYCRKVLEPYFRKLIAEGGHVTSKNAPKPFFRSTDL